jgi:hypothetical protein
VSYVAECNAKIPLTTKKAPLAPAMSRQPRPGNWSKAEAGDGRSPLADHFRTQRMVRLSSGIGSSADTVQRSPDRRMTRILRSRSKVAVGTRTSAGSRTQPDAVRVQTSSWIGVTKKNASPFAYGPSFHENREPRRENSTVSGMSPAAWARTMSRGGSSPFTVRRSH